MPRLLAVCAVASPGGAELGLLRLLGRLPPDWSIAVSTPGPGPVADAVAGAGWRTLELDAGGLGRRQGARALLALHRLQRAAGEVDVVYFNGGVSARLLAGGGLPRGVRSVLHVHDMVERVPRHWRRADVVLADSHAVAARLGRLEAHVVGCPVELDPPAVDAPWPRGGPVVGFVGRLEPRKGALDLVRAAPLLRRARPDVRVVLVGDDAFGADPGYTREVQDAPGVEHYGWVDDAAGVMRHLDVLVVPSREEPFGTVAAEAMAVGTPVVATRVGGLPEVVEDGVTGLLVEPGRPEQLAAAVVRVLEHRPALGAAARERARRFAVEPYARRVEELIRP